MLAYFFSLIFLFHSLHYLSFSFSISFLCLILFILFFLLPWWNLNSFIFLLDMCGLLSESSVSSNKPLYYPPLFFTFVKRSHLTFFLSLLFYLPNHPSTLSEFMVIRLSPPISIPVSQFTLFYWYNSTPPSNLLCTL